ncbi:MAG: FliM/FliN family flagellar motor switch protein [Deltaproteobacteria bacterium]|nr:FliM/FliN family flagellar motor switch protein [Deltaproteobacteria bacterium]
MKKTPSDDPLALDDDLADFEELEGVNDELDLEPPPAPKAAPPKPKAASPKETPPPKVEKTDIDALDLSPDVSVQLVAVMAKKTVSLRELLDLHMGQVIDLQRPPSEQVDLVANGKLVARGELVELDGRLGVRILKLVR